MFFYVETRVCQFIENCDKIILLHLELFYRKKLHFLSLKYSIVFLYDFQITLLTVMISV